ncbi:hypothetical protein Ae201684_004072 [Aphanomyces euteiches]|uniref:Protein DPCD n=1 Tax=Aphanomyces euteiches TaxID=100861 RepID=A0A6G0XJM7_9STRA|nr:hypothetical protein Ae201684_004072 [Aphanomyces euteiches]
MVEEYTADGRPQLLGLLSNRCLGSLTTHCVVRRWKAPSTLGGDGKWMYEIGEATPGDGSSEKDIGISLSGVNPIFLCREAEEVWEWRVRNLPYPKETYLISIDDTTQEIVIRTTNKKYFKRFRIPAMARANLRLDGTSLSHSHSNNTLVIQYEKPDQVIEDERKSLKERLKREGDPQCRQQ